jgi:hypothetical protein
MLMESNTERNERQQMESVTGPHTRFEFAHREKLTQVGGSSMATLKSRHQYEERTSEGNKEERNAIRNIKI